MPQADICTTGRHSFLFARLALYAFGDQVGEQMLGDHELAADKVFAAAGMGALMGAAGGGLLGFGGSLAKSGVQAALPAMRGGLSRVLGEGGAGAKTSLPLTACLDAGVMACTGPDRRYS